MKRQAATDQCIACFVIILFKMFSVFSSFVHIFTLLGVNNLARLRPTVQGVARCTGGGVLSAPHLEYSGVLSLKW
jgi:hypothetical protein